MLENVLELLQAVQLVDEFEHYEHEIAQPKFSKIYYFHKLLKQCWKMFLMGINKHLQLITSSC